MTRLARHRARLLLGGNVHVRLERILYIGSARLAVGNAEQAAKIVFVW